MAEDSQKQLPKFDSLEALIEFFDEDETGDYLEKMPEAIFEVNVTCESNSETHTTKNFYYK